MSRHQANLSEAAAAQPGGGLRQLALRGVSWTTLGYGVSQILRLGANLALTRLLVPEYFGVMALVNIVLQGLQMFSDVGIRPSIIRSERGEDPTFVNVAWTLQVLRGGALWVVCALLAWPVAAFYGQPELRLLLIVAAFSALIAGFQSTAIMLANRAMRFGRITLIEIASQAIGAAVMIVWALFSPSVWALVTGGIAGALTRTILSHTVLSGVPARFRWDPDCLRELITFGRWIFASTALTFLVSQGDRLFFGKVLTMETLGVYSIAIMFALLPQKVLIRISSGIMMPVYSRLHREGQDMRAVYDRVRRPLVLVAAVMSAWFVACGPILIDVLYDPRYAASGWMLQLLGFTVLIHIFEATNGSMLLAAGNARAVAAGNFAKFAAMAALVPTGWYVAALPGAILGLLAAEFARYATSLAFVSGMGVRTISADAAIFGKTILAAVFGLGVARVMPAAVPTIVTGALATAAVLLVWATDALVVYRTVRARQRDAIDPPAVTA